MSTQKKVVGSRKDTIKNVLIANRGEIALQIQRACREMGIKTVSIASEADKGSLHARKAQELVIIGPAPARESYLAIDKIIAVAKEKGCDAIHPGYGFLSENGDFAEAVTQAGLIFIGPTAEVIRTMGNKSAARACAQRVGVPCSPGTSGGLTDKELEEHAEKIGFPVILKASAGGGGRGMRIFRKSADLHAQLSHAREEVVKHFGSSDVFLEKYIENPRHVEVQVFGDTFGSILHFGTRDCSTQRRHQKLVEEAPAPNIPERLRERMHRAAVAVAKSVGYTNAGTVEFLLSGKEFYFLEMNTRIQVEYPVTEAVTGLELIKLQIRIARGEPLPITQKQVQVKGHAFQFRINAEDPAHNFTPARGMIEKINRVKAPYVREDNGYEEGDEIPLYYDGLISKLIVKGRNRSDVIKKSRVVLSRYSILGVPTSLDLDRWLLENGVFKANPVDIGFIEREFLKRAHSASSCVVGSKDEERATVSVSPFEYFKRALKDKKLWDPRHALKSKVMGEELNNNEVGGLLAVEDKHLYEYESKKFKTRYTIEVLHREDGFFLATPVNSDGLRGRKESCRTSNGLDMVVRSLISEVLEKTPPSEMFTEAQ